MKTRPVYWDYAIFNEKGYFAGIRDDAPDDIKAAYQEDIRENEERKKNGMYIDK